MDWLINIGRTVFFGTIGLAVVVVVGGLAVATGFRALRLVWRAVMALVRPLEPAGDWIVGNPKKTILIGWTLTCLLPVAISGHADMRGSAIGAGVLWAFVVVPWMAALGIRLCWRRMTQALSHPEKP